MPTLAYIFTGLWIVFMVDGIVPQIETAFGMPNFVPLKVLLIGICLLAAVLRRELPVPRRVFYCWSAFVLYLLLDFFIVSNQDNYSLQYLVLGYNTHYSYLILFPLVFALQGMGNSAALERLLLAVFIPLAIIGLLQHFLNEPFLLVETSSFSVVSWRFFDQVRAFSLFSTAIGFGHFITLMIGLLIPLIFQTKGIGRYIYVMLLLAGMATAYATLTRLVYFEVILAMLTVTFIEKRAGREKILFSVILYGLLGLAVACGANIIADYMDLATDLATYNSLDMRYTEWQELSRLWLDGNAAQILFGQGLFQSESAMYGANNITIDNTILALGLQIGVIGLVLNFAFLWSIWEYMVANRGANNLTKSVTALFSTWLFTGMFNTTFVLLPLIVMIGLLPARTVAGKFVHRVPSQKLTAVAAMAKASQA